MRVQVRVVAVALAACACGSQVPSSLALTFSLRPAAIDDLGQRSVLSFAVYDQSGVSADGTVTVTAGAGLLAVTGRDPGKVQEVELDDAGTAVVAYTCARALDPGCHGAVKLDAVWTRGSQWLEVVKRVNVGDGGL